MKNALKKLGKALGTLVLSTGVANAQSFGDGIEGARIFNGTCEPVLRITTEFADRNCDWECFAVEDIVAGAAIMDRNGDGQVTIAPYGTHVPQVGESPRYTAGRVNNLREDSPLIGQLRVEGLTANFAETLDSAGGQPATVDLLITDNISGALGSTGTEYVSRVGVSQFQDGMCFRQN